MSSGGMEAPLITEESVGGAIDRSSSGSSSDGGGGGGGGGLSFLRWRLRKTRSEAITYGTSYQRAAALVDLAEDGIGLPEEVLDDHRFGKAAKFYFIYIKFHLLWSLNLFALLLLNFLEKPLWCLQKGQSCQDREYYFLGQLPYLTSAESLIYEGITLLILIINTLFPVSYEGHQLYWKNRLNILKVVLLLLLVCDMLVYALLMSPTLVTLLPFRFAPYIRVAFLALSIRELRSCIITLAGMCGMYLNILALSLAFLLFSSWLAYVTFEDTEQGKTVFTSYGATLYQMFVLFTTSNNPDVWIPAYKNSRWSCIFFVLYVLVGVYFLTNLILAVVYDSFKAQLARQVVGMDCMRTRILRKAFSVIDKSKRGFLYKDQCICLFKELNKYRSLPKTSKEDFELIFCELDASGDFKINMEEFSDLCNAIALKFQKEPAPSWLENYPSFYHSGPSKNLKAFVTSPVFGFIVAFVLVLNFVTVVIETTLDIQNNSGQIFWLKVEFLFGWLYVLEVILKIYSVGFDKYWMDGQNKFDFVVTWIIVIGETATFFFPNRLPLLSNGEWIRYLLIARMLRLIRLLMHVERYRAFLTTFFTLIPSLMPYLGTIFCIMCIYCSLGLQLFGGIVNSGNSDIKATDLYDNDYLLFNFNDYPNGMVTLFNLLVTGNWQAWMQMRSYALLFPLRRDPFRIINLVYVQTITSSPAAKHLLLMLFGELNITKASYKDLTGTSWTLVYFVSFYLITVLLLLNLVLAFVLEAFFMEMELETSQTTHECREDDMDAPRMIGRRRSIGVKSRSRTVDILLHHILSDELTQGSEA